MQTGVGCAGYCVGLALQESDIKDTLWFGELSSGPVVLVKRKRFAPYSGTKFSV
jgi:hypothetical protein